MPPRLDTAALVRLMLGIWAAYAVASVAPQLVCRLGAVQAEIEAQPSPATWYLQKWHNRC